MIKTIQEHQNKFKPLTPTKQTSDKFICNVHEAYEEFPAKEMVSKKDFITIIKSFNLLLFNEIITTGVGFKIPYGVGIFGVLKKKYKKASNVNWESTQESGEIVRFNNSITSQFTPKFVWLKTRSYGGRFAFTDIWRFRLNKDLSGLLYHEAMHNNNIVKYF